jgi:flagellar biosynthesis protein
MNPKERKISITKAVALRYRPDKDRAPKVTAKGTGRIAQKIIELAKRHDVPIKEDPELAELLSKLDFYQEIPPDLYLVIAEILAFIYSVNHQWQGLKEKRHP